MLYGVCSLVGGLAFVMNGRGYSNITGDIERTAARLGAKADSKNQNGTTTSTDENDGQANGHSNGSVDLKPVRRLGVVRHTSFKIMFVLTLLWRFLTPYDT